MTNSLKPRARAAGRPKTDDRDRRTETRILEAARRVFTKRGTSGTRVQDIAAEAGVNQALVHYYFRSKDALAERVFVDIARQSMGAIVGVADPRHSLEQLIEAVVSGYIDTLRHFPFVPAYLLAEASQHPERLDQLMQAAVGTVPRSIAGPMLQRIEQEMARRVTEGSMRAITPRQLMVNVMALTVFPFVARPVLSAAFGFDDQMFSDFLDERRRELPGFIINALRP